MRRNSIVAGLLTAIFFIACVAAPVAAREIEGAIPDTSRVVSIGDSITEIVFALGEEKRLVGRDSTSTYPAAANALPDVGYMRALSPEGVLSINPTAIIAVEGSGPREAVDVLRKASVPFVFVPEKYTAESLVEKIRIVGRALGVDEKAEQLARRTEAELEEAQADAKKVATPKRVLFVLSSKGGKIMGAGSGTAADGILKLAGAQNAVAGFSGYKPLNDESIIMANPDIILAMDRSGGDHKADNAELLANKALAATPAGRDKRIVRLGGQYMLGFGPRTANAVRDLYNAFYKSQPGQ
ncbi:hemin ABC transporter substrate-binding protein [Phyllobacterium sp. 21LDTY02-6]|uniref:heme/hemin ABC transporter substrate-binding protein n=1 Tax=Phyllobacterium sp. 21LDTY02-6 TaxID=2944903 RepID=UPI00202000A2|nr:hemin ABC transporter substrate-binding protein [Phyllobacterium sp. 21LDTY02-6]MCO4319315.1 hemin ABC transporter substrate-binding protein [Phyllobacterium sp. 21LDTY02-6]